MIEFSKDLKQEAILKKEILTLYDLDWNTEAVDMTIKSKGDSGRLEKIIKRYYNELYKYRKEYDQIDIRGLCINILEIQNLKTNNLTETKASLITSYDISKKATYKIIELIDNNYILGLIDNKKFNDYYIDLYKEYMFPDDDEKLKQDWIDKANYNKFVYELTLEALNILINNSSSWHIEDNKLYFYDDNLLKEYNEIVDLLNSDYESNFENM